MAMVNIFNIRKIHEKCSKKYKYSLKKVKCFKNMHFTMLVFDKKIIFLSFFITIRDVDL